MALEDDKSKGDVLQIDSEQAQELIAENPSGSSPWKAILANPKIVALCLYANLGALMYGFDNLVLSLALTLPPFSYATYSPLEGSTASKLLTVTKKTIRIP
jgi:SP family general alpha glucoside:H+ symporter-like MFS transporter